MVINPLTNRPIQFGGKTYKKLLKEGIIKSVAPDENVLYSINENDDVDAVKKNFKSKLKYGETAVKGRKGTTYENKIVKRKVQPQPDEVIKASASAVANNTDFDAKELEDMILAELFGTTKSKPISIKREKAKPKKQVKYSKKQMDTDTELDLDFSESEKEEEYVEEEEENDSDE